MHIKADEEHGDEAIDLVARHVHTPEDRAAVYTCTLETAERFYALWDLYRTAG
jgi:hypothetical protein